MKPDRLLTLQHELFTILASSKTLKINIEAPPWDLQSWQKVKSLAKHLNETGQSVLSDSSLLEEWLDKCSFFEQTRPDSYNSIN